MTTVLAAEEYVKAEMSGTLRVSQASKTIPAMKANMKIPFTAFFNKACLQRGVGFGWLAEHTSRLIRCDAYMPIPRAYIITV
jgi:hypothetical protein